MSKTLKGAILALAVLLVGCSTGSKDTKQDSDYQTYVKAQVAIETAKADAEKARWNAVQALGANGSDVVKATLGTVAAMGGPNSGQGGKQNDTLQRPERPETASDTVFKYMSLILPNVVSIYGIHSSTQVADTASNNARDVAVSTNSAFTAISGNGAAATNTLASKFNTTTPSNTYTISGGNTVLGNGNLTATDSHAVATTSSTTDSHNVATTTSTTDNHSTTSSTDNHSTTSSTDSHNTVTCTATGAAGGTATGGATGTTNAAGTGGAATPAC